MSAKREADWTAIRAEYESGEGSLRSLAAKYGVSKSSIGERKYKERWREPGQVSRSHAAPRPLSARQTDTRTPVQETPPIPLRFPVPDDAVAIARLGLSQLASLLGSEGTTLSVSEHKSFADALSQYTKIITSAPQTRNPEAEWQVPLGSLSPAARLKMRALLAEDAQREEGVG